MTRPGEGSRPGGIRWGGALPSGLPALLAAVALPTLAAGCGGDSAGDSAGDRSDAPARDTAAAADADSVPAADSALAADSRPLRAFRVRIGNEGADTAVIAADAGAGARTVDTVPPADSGVVRVETRAPLLELRARTGPGGEVLARSRYDLERSAGDTLLEFRVPPARPTAPDTAGR